MDITTQNQLDLAQAQRTVLDAQKALQDVQYGLSVSASDTRIATLNNQLTTLKAAPLQAQPLVV